MSSTLSLITSVTVVTIVALSTTASCDCLVPANDSIGLDRGDFVAVFADSAADVDANWASLDQALALMNLTMTRTQLAAFLGTIRFNTGNLRRHRARCAETGTCPVQYDLVCADRAPDDTRRFYPRSALMIAYQCNYADVDAVLRARLPCLASIEAQPDLLTDRLLYSYLASVAAWASTECMALTATDLDRFGTCLDILNPWMCTDQGQDDRRDLIAAVNVALTALNVTGVQLPSAMNCTVPVQAAIDSGNATHDNVTVTDVVAGNATSSNVTLDDATSDDVTVADSDVTSSNVTQDDDVIVTEIGFGALSRDLFRSYFSDVNVSVVDDHYDGLTGALLLDGVDQFDPEQAALVLAAVDIRTANLAQANATGTEADRVRASVQVVLHRLSRGLPATSPIRPDLVLFYAGLVGDVVRSGCMGDVRRGLYDVCLGALFPERSCAEDAVGHDAVVAAMQKALVLEDAETDVNEVKCRDDDDVTSSGPTTSPASIWAMITAVAAVVAIVA